MRSQPSQGNFFARITLQRELNDFKRNLNAKLEFIQELGFHNSKLGIKQGICHWEWGRNSSLERWLKNPWMGYFP
jgi:hypothetical protein